MGNLSKKRADYKPLFWLTKDTFLEFLVFEKYTIVKSQIIYQKNDSKKISNFNLDSHIELNGVDLDTKKFQLVIDDNPIKNIKIETLKKVNQAVIIPVPSDSKLVKTIAEVKIYPLTNSSLEGLYESNHMLCTQCEPEGFRKITWFPDRPDNLSLFTVKIEVSDKFKTILSNGNLIEEGNIKNRGSNRSFKVWQDPFPKPSYLFALIVGNLESNTSKFITSSKKEIEISIFSEIGNKHLTNYAMKSLKKAMRWDEKKYGLEYDLDSFMIIAVSHFNMGAMENKGLNIFNSKFVLADKKTATDKDLQNIESIVAHEYFHNWTGNRITCRDWFQLTLKEGLTVFRDQEFSADMNNRGVKRIEDVSLLKSVQFAEDAGSNSHSIRPDEYKEINNFYTPTIYEKGAEVIRMIYNYLGDILYKKGMDLYFERYDGRAITCEHFIKALSDGSQLNLRIFEKWYSQSGTPYLKIIRNVINSGLELNFSQKVNKKNSNLPIPIKIAILNKKGSLVKFKLNNSELKFEHVYLLSKSNEKVSVACKEKNVIPSILRDFSAPVLLKTDYKIDEYMHILKFDNDSFNKWDAAQNLYLHCFFKNCDLDILVKTLNDLLLKKGVNYSLMALLLETPSLNMFENLQKTVDPIFIFNRKKSFMKNIALSLQEVFEKTALKLLKSKIYDNKSIGERALLGKILNYLLLIDNEVGIEIAKKISVSKNMTLSIIGLKSLCLSDSKKALRFLDVFYKKWEKNDLVIEKWFEMMSTLNMGSQGLNFIKDLLKHKAFDYKNPNKLRSVLNTFQKENILLFHANDSSGYKFISEQVAIIDKNNPQAAARLILPLTRFNNYTTERKNKIKEILKSIKKPIISNDLSEIIEKALI
mgnify:CR=1 FL=1